MESQPTTSTEAISSALQRIEFPENFHACGFRIEEYLSSEDKSIVEVVEIVIVFDAVEWDEDVERSCEISSNLCADAMSGLGFFCLPLCRTRSEHEEVAGNDFEWTMVDPNDSC